MLSGNVVKAITNTYSIVGCVDRSPALSHKPSHYILNTHTHRLTHTCTVCLQVCHQICEAFKFCHYVINVKSLTCRNCQCWIMSHVRPRYWRWATTCAVVIKFPSPSLSHSGPYIHQVGGSYGGR